MSMFHLLKNIERNVEKKRYLSIDSDLDTDINFKPLIKLTIFIIPQIL